jgi:hypothetical protein
VYITLAIIVLLGIAFWFYNSRATKTIEKKPAANAKLTKINPTKLDGKYRSAEIVPSLNCCQAAKAIKGKVFLLNDAPQIPLSACDMPDECKCKYVRFNDRRRGNRRDNLLKAVAIREGYDVELKEEKRVRRGRRSTD